MGRDNMGRLFSAYKNESMSPRWIASQMSVGCAAIVETESEAKEIAEEVKKHIRDSRTGESMLCEISSCKMWVVRRIK
jgi:hypothetical protein